MAITLLVNGVIHTLDSGHGRVEALAVSGQRIVALGTDDEILAVAGAQAVVLDLRGKCVIPGMIDAHLHFASVARRRQQLDPRTATLDELLRRVSARVAGRARGEWILGFGWDQNVWGTGFPHRRALDAVAPHHPVFLRAKSGHAAWANSEALRIAGVGRDTVAEPGGEILRDGAGEPTGVLLEAAQGLIENVIPEPSLDDAVQAMGGAQQEALAMGLTGVHDMDGVQALRAWQVLRERDELHLRVCKSVPGSLLPEAVDLGLRFGLGDAWLRLGGVKLFADGALGPRTAWMLLGYTDEVDNQGMPATPVDELSRCITQASAAGLPAWIHAIGDRANHEVLNILSRVRQQDAENAPHGLRHRLEHAQLLAPPDRGRLAALDVIASMQPIHCTADMEIADRYWGERASGAYAFRTLLGHGTHLAFGSDAPVECMDPLAGIHAAVTRRRPDGVPGENGWRGEQRLSVGEALHGYTLGAAYASGEEMLKGSLGVGKLADLVVLERDIFTMPPMEIAQAGVLATMVGGKWVFRRRDFDSGD